MNLRSPILTSVCLGLGLGALAGCNDGDGLAGKSKQHQQNVLVIDDGFDPTVAALKKRVSGLYTITCKDPTGPTDNTPPASFDEEKARALAALKVRDESCHITEGVTDKPDPFPTISKYQERLNDMFSSSKLPNEVFTQAEYNEIVAGINGSIGKAHFHGTATSSTIAYENPGVRLILVEEILGDAATAMQNFTCITQAELDDSVRLSSDPEVRQAIIDQPTSTEDEDLANLIKKHDVGVINESFGSFTRHLLEVLQMMNGCAAADLKPYFAVEAGLARARDDAHPLPDTLLVKSAGNEESEINAPEDAILCGGSATPRLAVGAYDLKQVKADFSNSGTCVDVFAPGTSVIGTLPHGWLLPLDGTSFSAPLVARLLSLDGAAFTTQGAHDAVLSGANADRYLPMARFPRTIFYDPAGEIGTQSLSRQSPLVAMTGGLPQQRFSMRALHKLLAGLHRGGR